jgi:CheY-like chemotaxis protein
MVHGLAAQSGGALVIRSAPGEGTNCTLWLPVSAEQVAQPGAAREPTLFRGSATVLVVDDEPLVLDSTAELVGELGYRVLRAGSGEAALALLGAHPEVAVVVTDFAMPGMTGQALAARVTERWPGLPVILATGHAGPWPGAEEGMVRLAKPFGLAQLSEALVGALRRRAAE